VKLKEALSNPPLAAGRVVAGKNNVDKDISWVQVVDHPDIESWVKEGHLLLSTGYNWPKSEAEAASIVEKLALKGISGVVLAVPHFLDHFPQSSVQAAERVGLTLIELPWDVPFSEITQAVHRELVDQQSLALMRSEQIHRELTEAAVSGASLSDVAQVLGRVLARSVQICSVDGNVLGAYTPSDRQPKLPVGRPAADGFRALVEAEAIGQVDASSHPVRLKLGLSGTKEQVRLVAYAARVRADRVGYVIATEGAEPLSALDLRAIEHAGTVAALQISHQRELSMQEARLGYALVASLIEGRFEEKPQTLERAKLSGWNNEARYRLCTVLLDEPNPLSRQGFARREEFAARANMSLMRRGVRPLLSLSANQIHILIPDGLDIDMWWSEFAPTRMAMGVSQAKVGVEGMRAAGQETSELIEHLKPGRVYYFEQMLFPRVLNGDPDAKRVFLAQLFGPLEENKRGRQLLETALALAEEGFHLQRTAERMNIHLSTLRYRLGRLSELTGLDLESPEGRFRLQVGARLYLMNESE
jgi:purine catabolism regulator